MVLFALHVALTLQLFGRSAPWRKLVNDDPVTSGRHPLHLEEGGRDFASTFDPTGYAGYPRTPVFDSESQPAEWFQFLAGGLPARTYKIGLAVSYGIIPVILWLATVVLQTCRGVSFIAVAFGILVAWSTPAVAMIEAGDVGIAWIGVLAVLGLAMLGRWHVCPGAAPWCGLVAVTTLGWTIEPSPWLLYLAISFAGWAIVGHWHRLRWHVGFVLAHVAALVLSYPAWGDWLRDWWVRLSLTGVMPDVSVRQLAAFGLWLVVLPAAWVVSQVVRRLAARPSAGLIVGSTVFMIAAGVLARPPGAWERPTWGPRPLSIGFHGESLALEDAIRAASLPDARVLWEELPGRSDLGWTALLPRRLGRPFIGGLDPEGVLEHASCALRAGALAGRPLSTWSDAELDGYACRYNVGCVVCASAAARNRIDRWTEAEAIPLAPQLANWGVFTIHRPHSYILKGRARQFEADAKRVTLADVVPEDGDVVLSLHYQEGWHARPEWVRVERELDAYDPIPFVRLRLPGPVGRITLTWNDR